MESQANKLAAAQYAEVSEATMHGPGADLLLVNMTMGYQRVSSEKVGLLQGN